MSANEVVNLAFILKQHRYQRIGIVILLAYVFIYLWVTDFIRFSFGAPAEIWFQADISPLWQSLIFQQRTPFLFESVGRIQLTPYIEILLSVPNLFIGLVISLLVALNIVVSVFMFHNLGLKGVKGATSLVGTIPALLGGAACCAPTLILVLGLQFTAALTTIWPWFVPASIILLTLSLWWSETQIKNNLHPGICRPPKR